MARKTRKKSAAAPTPKKTGSKIRAQVMAEPAPKAGRKRTRSRKAGRARRRLVLPVAGWIMSGLVLAVVLSVLYVRFLPPPIGVYMLSEHMRLGGIERDWVPISAMSPDLARSAVAAEDANFCLHWGLDFDAIRDALDDDSRVRGGSTITQQVAKNVYLWPERSWLRKGLEAGLAGLIELTWPKRRIIEVYLNVAEFDEGVFGVAAATQHYFGVPPDKVSATQAARLAAVLPSPKKSSAGRPSAYVRKRGGQILSGAGTIAADGRADCFNSG